MNTFAQILAGLVGSLLLTTAAFAQSFSIDTFTIAGGSGTVTGGPFVISGTVGQPDADLALSGGAFSLASGFWSSDAENSSSQDPGGPIFDNTGGSDNGGFGATGNQWLASKFCLGSEPYQLDSLTLLLSNGSSTGQPAGTSTVRLQIYANDPVHGKPSTSTGLIMNLSGLTNPITIGTLLVEWIPNTPFSFSADTCYWAVFSVEEGATLGQIASVTKPTGAAATLGTAQSLDGGATWGIDNSFNFKMLIQGTAISTPAPSPGLAADGSTTIPGGTGTFTSFPLAPSLNGDDAAFLGMGSGGQQGVYVLNRDKSVTRIVDLNTPVPNGAGNFLSFGSQAGIIIVGGDVLFNASGSGGQQGVYLSSHGIPQEPLRIADTAMNIPGGTGTFTGFQNSLGFSGSAAAFVGTGSGGQQGVYMVAAMSPPQVAAPFRVADTTTAIPGGNGNFISFPAGPAISGAEVAFIGNGSGAQQGLYRVAALSPSQAGASLRIADTTTAIPGGAGTFASFGTDQADPIDPGMSGDHLAFIGSGSGGQQGVYTVAGIAAPQIGSPERVADTTTAMPGGTGNFSSFDAVSVSDTDTAFLGHGASGQTGIYDLTGGQLRKVVSVGDSLQGKTIAGLRFSRGGLFGDPVAFQATFSDGSEGVFTMNVAPSSPQLRITSADLVEQDLRLTFIPVAGQSYTIQSRADLSSGTWSNLSPSPAVLSTGSSAQVRLPIDRAQPKQFYRLQVTP